MEPAAPSPKKRPAAPPSPTGELIVQNGKQLGARRPLGMPMTFIGQAPGCDVRLKGDGIEPMHCLLVHGPNGLQLRDLDSSAGTLVNGNRVTNVRLCDGDLLAVGGFQFRVRLPGPISQPATNPAEAKEPAPISKDALRVQAAAVAAQQAALGEQEVRLHQQRGTLEQQQEQLSGHLEDKRRKLVHLSDRAQSERAALKQDRDSYERFVDQVTGDLTQAQRELVENQQQVQAERRRLANLHRRLRQRWHRHWLAEKQKLRLREEELANEECNLGKESERQKQQKEALDQDRLSFNGQYEMGRRQLLNAWAKFREAQEKWRQRRNQERAALRVRARDIEGAEIAFAESRRQIEQAQSEWQNQRLVLEKEADGLNNRIRHQRDKVFEQQQEISRLDALLRERRRQLATSEKNAASEGKPPDQAPASAAKKSTSAAAPKGPTSQQQEAEAQLQRRLADLDRLAGELADQRLQLAEQWEHLVQTQDRWQQDRDQAAGELEGVALHLQEQEKSLAAKEQAIKGAAEGLRKKHREIVQLRQQMVGWRARLRTRESAWEGERNNVLAEVRHREQLVEKHLNNLVEIRQRWAKHRRQEVDRIRADQSACEKLRKEYVALRQDWQRRAAALDEERRILAEKTLALEQFRQETFTHSGDGPAAERRVERLRRRWLSTNAAAIRTVAREREVLLAKMTDLEARFADLQKRADTVAAAEAVFVEKQTALEHKQTLLAAQHARMKQELQTAHAQRAVTEHQLTKMKDEVERIARALLDEPDPPTLPVGKAA